jgi:carbonic anhydrase
MWKWRAVAVLVCAVVLAGCNGGSGDEGAAGDAPAWSHNPDDASLGPENWGEIDDSFEQCLAGESQSPVDITGAVAADLPDLEFDYPETSLVVENTGHTIEASVPESSNLTLTIGDDVYRLVQFHFHAPSEHTLDGRSYAVETHLVHESENGELAVVALLAEPGDVGPELDETVLESAPEEAGEEVELGEWSPLLLLGVADSTTGFGMDYFAYSGSLTTPGCSEAVRWIVMSEALPTRQEAIDRLHELIADFPGYDGYENNNRPTQPLNDREIERARAG